MAPGSSDGPWARLAPDPLAQRALRDSELDPTAKLVGFVISTYMDTRGKAFPSKATIAEGASLGKGKRAVDKAVDRLEAYGLLDVTRSKGRRPFHYQAVLTSQADATFNVANRCEVDDLQSRTSEPPTSHQVRPKALKLPASRAGSQASRNRLQ
jgi:hypothetical protein